MPGLRTNDAATLREWMMSPRSDTGIHLATDDGGWDFVPYAALADDARRIARSLVADGVGSGTTVGVLIPTSRLCVATMFGVLAAGGTLTPITPPQFEDPDRYADRLRGILRASEARVVVSSPAFAETVHKAMSGMAEPPNVSVLGQVPDVAPLDELAEPGPLVLLQMTSGSTAAPRGVCVSWRNLVANLGAIHAMCDTKPGERGASWLPLYHDMGLIGGMFLSVPGQYEVRLLRPDQFIRDPLRWLQAAALAEHTVSPSFGLEYVSRRLTPQDLGDLDLSGLRTMVVGADRINPAHLRAFTELTAGHGFSPSAFLPSYGLAEMTLIATGQRLGEPIRMTRIDRTALRPGRPVQVLGRTDDGLAAEPSPDWIVSVGRPIPGHAVRIVDESGAAASEGALGEIVLSGPCVAEGYRGDPAGATRFERGDLRTGDAGFLLDGQLHVLGRMGTSLKVNGRTVFAEDLDVAATEAMALRPGRLVTVAVNDGDVPGVAVVFERSSAPMPAGAVRAGITAVRAHAGDDTPLWFISVPRGGLLRTSSGKPRRSYLWQQWRSGRLTGSELLAVRDPRHPSRELDQVRALFDRARAMAVVPDDATVHFEGSLAEGFGNACSDIDFLLLVPGSAKHAVMPTVLFVDGHRVEIRAQSHDQARKRLLRVRTAIDSGSLKGVTEDLLNRVQRFLRGVPLRVGPQYGELLDIVSYREATGLTATWWRKRSAHCLRHSAALVALDHEDEAASWAREGLAQAMKAFLAEHGEGYLEIKWLPQQIARLRRQADRATTELLDEYEALDYAPTAAGGRRELTARLHDLAARLGAPTVTFDPANVILRRVPGVTTWPIGATTHVVRDEDVFVLSAACADSWRRVVFGQTLASTKAASRHVRLFARHGLIALAWRGAGLIRPAAAMCEPDRPLTPLPSTRRPVITIDGAPTDGDIARSPLRARAFAECAGALMLANMVLENAREDFDGAVKDEQWRVTSLCARRIAVMAVRILASAWGITPLPGDPVLFDTLEQLVPGHRDLARTARDLVHLPIRDRDGALRAQSELDTFVARVRQATGGEAFPASFASREEWQRTLRRGYQWLRMGAYLDADVELDETRDLLASGGAQPGERR
ncbi:AMP-binding protein [Mycobacterium sp. Marseille-P9652]|uniref:AMP-binding protein n=1 Tax=Mycobacterium sp. Marseille-P9652 TaxID=2654950 RepID=UPI0012E834DB|nr:AMP-binding protein [Mycobacterium sp. Marseille-P9652]